MFFFREFPTFDLFFLFFLRGFYYFTLALQQKRKSWNKSKQSNLKKKLDKNVTKYFIQWIAFPDKMKRKREKSLLWYEM